MGQAKKGDKLKKARFIIITRVILRFRDSERLEGKRVVREFLYTQGHSVNIDKISTNLHTFTFNGAKGLYTYRIVSSREVYTGKLVFE